MLEELKKWRQYQARCESANWQKEDQEQRERLREIRDWQEENSSSTDLTLKLSPAFAGRLGIEPSAYSVLQDEDGWFFCWLSTELRLVFRFEDYERKEGIDGVVWFMDKTRTAIEEGEVEITT